MPVGVTLRQAAELIEAKGLARGDYTDDQGRICAMEAMWRAATGTEDAAGWRVAASTGRVTLHQQNQFRYAMITFERWLGWSGSIARWSDRRTAAEVTAAMRACAQEDAT